MTIVDLSNVKVKLSHRDLLLLLGIIVALVIAVSTLVYSGFNGYTKQNSNPQKSGLNSTPAVIVKRLVERVSGF